MPKYLFRLNNGSPEDHVVDLPDDSAALDEGLRTAAGMVRDISLPHIGSETHMLEVTEDGGKRILTEIRAAIGKIVRLNRSNIRVQGDGFRQARTKQFSWVRRHSVVSTSDGYFRQWRHGFRAKRRRDGGGAFYRSRSITRPLPLFD